MQAAQEYKVPRYYEKLYSAVVDPAVMEELKERRYQRALELPREESSPARRAVREEVMLRRQMFYNPRTLE